MSKQYDIKVFKMVSWNNQYFNTELDARMEGSRLRALYQKDDPNHEYHFEIEEVEEEEE